MLFRSLKMHLIKNFFSIITYLIIGVISAIIYFATFCLQWRIFHFHYEVAASTAYIITILFHFNANRRITFNSHYNYVGQQIIKYGLLLLFNYFMTMSILHFSVEKWHLSPYLGVLIGISATTGIGYLLSRYWVFTTNN